MKEQSTVSQTLSINLDVHHKKCNGIFSEINNGEDIYVNVPISQVDLPSFEFERINDDSISSNEEDSIDSCIYLPILSNQMLQYDEDTFRENLSNNQPIEYRPYFSSFIVPLTRENLRVLRELNLDWYNAKIVSTDMHEDNLSGDDNSPLDKILDSIDSYDFYLTGILCTSASPVNYSVRKRLFFKNKSLRKDVLDRINNIYDCSKFNVSNNEDIQTALSVCWGSNSPRTIDIYNVGHANADYIRGSSKKILFDIGYNYRHIPNKNPQNSSFPKAVNALRRLKPSCVIISHWDQENKASSMKPRR